ncbi:MAG: exodeoxyribonuclease VII small subunit [Firmicutes bacterium]|nr:exodeoxyribonuclease VII small subunit [Bacillota bacterium]
MADKQEMTFEEAFQALEKAAEALRSGKLGLEESIEVYDNSILYYQRCRQILDGAKQKILKYDPTTDETEEFDR